MKIIKKINKKHTKYKKHCLKIKNIKKNGKIVRKH